MSVTLPLPLLSLLVVVALPMFLSGADSKLTSSRLYRKVTSKASLKPLCNVEGTPVARVKVNGETHCATLCLGHSQCVAFNVRYDVTTGSHGDERLHHECEMFDRRSDCYSQGVQKCKHYQIIDPEIGFSLTEDEFIRVGDSSICYQIILEMSAREDGRSLCTKLHPSAELIYPQTLAEFNLLQTYLNSTDLTVMWQSCKYVDYEIIGLLTSGERTVHEDCNSPYVWKPDTTSALGITYSAWTPEEPDCRLDTVLQTHDNCINLESPAYTMVDILCMRPGCPVCQLNNSEQES